MAPTRKPSLPVLAIARDISENRKLTSEPWLRPVAATHTSQWSCPLTCPLRGRGCYAETGQQAFVTKRLNAAPITTDNPHLEIAYIHAGAIDGLSGRWPLRLDVVGDISTNEAARIVAEAVARYIARGSKIMLHPPVVWAYTHAWREVDRASWGSQISVLASCETDRDVAEATARGYAVALLRKHAELPREVAGLRTIACPEQTGGKPDCESCRLCTHGAQLHGRALIALDPHGPTRKVAAALAARHEAEANEADAAIREAERILTAGPCLI